MLALVVPHLLVYLVSGLRRWIHEKIYLRLQTLSEPNKLDREHSKVEKLVCFSPNTKESQEIKSFSPSQILLISSRLMTKSVEVARQCLKLTHCRSELKQQQQRQRSRTQLETVRQEMTLRDDYSHSLLARDACTLQLHWLHSPRPQ